MDESLAEIIDDTICEPSEPSQKEASRQLTPEEKLVIKRVETPPVKVIKSALKRRLETTEKKTNVKDVDTLGWYCPEMEPPLANDSLEQMFKKSNETIVSYFKTGEKYKMVKLVDLHFKTSKR